MSDKRPAAATTHSTIKKRIVSRPVIVGTKASQARAKAVKTQLTPTKPNVVRKKRPAPEDANTPVKTYQTTASSLKQRPAWDLRVW